MSTLCLKQIEHPPTTQAYLRPFDLLEARGVRDLSVTHSVKFSYQSLETDRYFIRFPNSAIDAGHIAEICQSLGMPFLAESWVQIQAGGWTRAGSIGAARTHDAVAYRAYFRSGIEKAGQIYGRAIEWTSGARSTIVQREYTLLHASTAEEARSLIFTELALPLDAMERQVLDEWFKLLTSRAGKLHLLKVQEPSGGRLSFDAGPLFEEPLVWEDAAAACATWLRAFQISATGWLQLANYAAGKAIENIAIGRDSQNRLFITLYFGKYERPCIGIERHSEGISNSAPKSLSIGAPVFIIGTINVVSATEPRGTESQDAALNRDRSMLCSALAAQPLEAEDLVWTVDVLGTPAFALQGEQQYASATYQTLTGVFHEQSTSAIEYAAIAGRIVGEQVLPSGAVLPILAPTLRHLSTWTNNALLKATGTAHIVGLSDFVARLHSRPNSGIMPQDRALNFLSTQPAALGTAFEQASHSGRHFDSVSVQPHLFHSFGQDWWEVVLLFCSPWNRGISRLRAIFTIDVQEPVPVFASPMRLLEVP